LKSLWDLAGKTPGRGRHYTKRYVRVPQVPLAPVPIRHIFARQGNEPVITGEPAGGTGAEVHASVEPAGSGPLQPHARGPH